MADWISNDEATTRHRAYYGQFCNYEMMQMVAWLIGPKELAASRDEHFNDIALNRWESVGMGIAASFGLIERFKACGDRVSPCGVVCVAKEAARLWRLTQERKNDK